MKKLYYFMLLFLPGISLTALGQDSCFPPIATDRPSQGINSPFTVPKGHLQIETGLLYARFLFASSFFRFTDSGDPLLAFLEEKPIHQFQLPSFLIRLGLSEKLELRVGSAILHSRLNSKLNFFDPLLPPTSMT